MTEKLINIISKYRNIVFVWGGTGGHIQPIISLKRHLEQLYNTSSIFWIGWNSSQEEKAARNENISFSAITTLKLSTTRSFKILLYPFILIQGIFQARKIFKTIGQDNSVVFSKWWPGSVAVWIAAWSLNIPLHIHESDTVAGRSNRLLGIFATRIWLGFEQAKTYFKSEKCEVIGQIIDPIFYQKNIELTWDYISWKTDKPHIFVTCGSQGSRAIFESIITQFWTSSEYEWIIALGKLNTGMIDEFAHMDNCQAVNWLSQENIAKLIQGTDIAITRGSATALAEFTVGDHQSQLIIIPLPYSAWNHQYYNAIEYKKIWHILLEQSNLKNLKNTLFTITKNEWNWTKNK
jgi:UDP-N-acetylglucosamine--N-acetylmuramyl-(pentapeptide) pyrophosphoryl-undecaprenol N-acetylglucosamine transferase